MDVFLIPVIDTGYCNPFITLTSQYILF